MQQQRLETGAAGAAEALFGRLAGFGEALPELVLRRLGIGVADAPEALDERVALVIVPQLVEHAALRVGQDGVDRVEEGRVAAVEGGGGVLGEGAGGEEEEEAANHG